MWSLGDRVYRLGRRGLGLGCRIRGAGLEGVKERVQVMLRGSGVICAETQEGRGKTGISACTSHS